jgi:very-short-patch-repair endonuclease
VVKHTGDVKEGKTYNHVLVPRAREMRRDMTSAELTLWLEFLRNANPRVRRQRPHGSYILDFYRATLKLVIEVDGAQHFSTHGLEYDAERTATLEGAGLRIVRFTNTEVTRHLPSVLERLHQLGLHAQK